MKKVEAKDCENYLRRRVHESKGEAQAGVAAAVGAVGAPPTD